MRVLSLMTSAYLALQANLAAKVSACGSLSSVERSKL